MTDSPEAPNTALADHQDWTEEILRRQVAFLRAAQNTLMETRGCLVDLGTPDALRTLVRLDAVLDMTPEGEALEQISLKVTQLARMLRSASELLREDAELLSAIEKRLHVSETTPPSERGRTILTALDTLIAAAMDARSALSSMGADARYLDRALRQEAASIEADGQRRTTLMDEEA
jgi:hypothetical protein